MYKTLQLFTKNFTGIKVIKTHMPSHKVIKNARLVTAWIKVNCLFF